ncbi:MAG TPA: DPP IV N-terminal domain-containing protein [Saprospiraceae bacterium]|nr:DPP IV N-terminal domain-containing protein [Saprospiraceae bacterium]
MKKIIAAIVCGLFYVSISQAQLLNNKSIWYDGMFSEKRVPGFRFMNDGVHYTRLEDKAIIKYNFFKEKKPEVLLEKRVLQEVMSGPIHHYSFSANEKYILLESGKEKIYRRSYYADLYLYNRAAASLKSVSDHRIRAAEIDPQERHISYLVDNDLYVYNIQTGKEKRLTSDGKTNAIINGHADWVYEEEFAITSMHRWSPDGRYLTWVRLDETKVPVFHMKFYNDSLYPLDYAFKYPKVGEANSSWSLHLYDTKTGKQTDITPGDAKHYIPRLRWTPAGELCITQMNRHQNNLQLHLYNATENAWKLLYEESSPYYLNITDALSFLKDGSGFVWKSPKSGFNHLYLMDMQGNEQKALTKGEFPVTAFYGINEERESCITRLRRKMLHSANYTFMTLHQIAVDAFLKEKAITVPILTALLRIISIIMVS